MDLFGRWRAAADRVEAALAAHEAARRAGDDRLARGAQGGFRARWAELGRASARLLRLPALDGDRAEALGVLARCWPPPTAPRLPHDAATVRLYLKDASIEAGRLEVQTGRAGRGPGAGDEEWLTGSRRELNRALGKSPGYSDYIEREQAAGRLELRREGDRLAIRLRDPAEHRRVAEALARLRGQGPGV